MTAIMPLHREHSDKHQVLRIDQVGYSLSDPSEGCL